MALQLNKNALYGGGSASTQKQNSGNDLWSGLSMLAKSLGRDIGQALNGQKTPAEEPTSPTAPATVNLLDDHFEAYSKYLAGLQKNVQSAYDSVQSYYKNAPAAYTPSAWQSKADDAMNEYLNRGPFQFDVNGDAMYQQLKDQYIQQGNMAMMDTMGQAAAMTGGYGNSYAQNVGQQAYHQQLNQLNNVVPELYAMAQDRYDQEGQDILNRYSLYSDREAQEYEKYQGELANWMSRGQDLTDAYTAAQKQYADATTYKEMDEETLDRVWKKFAAAKDADELQDLWNLYESLGYNPATLYELASAKDRKR